MVKGLGFRVAISRSSSDVWGLAELNFGAADAGLRFQIQTLLGL